MKIFFPYDKIRNTQDDFIKDVQEAVKQKKHFIAHAPTGIGKTAAVLSSIIPYALEKELTIFFLTSRHTQHRIAIETLKDIKKKHNVGFNVVDLIGKRHMCSQFGVDSMGSQFYTFCKSLVDKKECEFYENTFGGAGYSFETRRLLDSKNEVYHVEEFLDLARKTRLCPYELALLKAKKSAVVIADYSYIFNPSIRDAFFKKSNKFLEKSIIIVDEAHNLPSRLRDMMSSVISTYILERALKEAELYEEAHKALIMIKDKLEIICIDLENERLVKKEEFIFENFIEMIGLLDIVSEDVIEQDKKISFTGLVSEFLKSWIGEDNGFARYIEKDFYRDKVNFKLNYKCLDPSFLMGEAVNNSQLILMSGTLLPLEMYRDLLGIKNVMLKEYENPFPKDNRLNLVVPETTTKYTKRSEGMFENIARKCSSLCNLIPGNVLMLFPSYEIMKTVSANFNASGKNIFTEIQGMLKEEKEEMLKKFKSHKNHGAVMLGVAGANFSEGIDLPGDELKAVIIVGLPLSKPDLETRSLISYYDERFGKGWDYGYIFPAMIKVVQGAGRCIRSETDKGVIIFLDERYSASSYFRCFPKNYNIKITKLPEEHIKKFFEAQDYPAKG
ncbi:ATP-dependent DNA helicase [Candidatus Woesearchaeota archaeon]|nr:ATP-dependent DNA helicase [Candidatus Woesearchaeota archaeon]